MGSEWLVWKRWYHSPHHTTPSFGKHWFNPESHHWFRTLPASGQMLDFVIGCFFFFTSKGSHGASLANTASGGVNVLTCASGNDLHVFLQGKTPHAGIFNGYWGSAQGSLILHWLIKSTFTTCLLSLTGYSRVQHSSSQHTETKGSSISFFSFLFFVCIC